jgi:hypothetical protein
MKRIDDQKFLRWFCRFAGWPSRYLDRCAIVIHASDCTNLEVQICNEVSCMLAIGWACQRASLLPGSLLLSPDDLFGLEETLTIHVGRLLRRHKVIDRQGHSTRRRTA